MGLVIDTSVLVTLERRGLALDDLQRAMPDPKEGVALTPFTVAVLLVGLRRTPEGSRRQGMERFLETLLEAIPVLPFGLLEARMYASLWAQLLSQGAKIGVMDALIAATAVAHDYKLLTENAAHFGRVPGLTVQPPRWN